MTTINLKHRNKPIRGLPASVQVTPKDSVDLLADKIATATRLRKSGIRLTVQVGGKSTVLDNGKLLADYIQGSDKVAGEYTVYVNYGLRLSWRMLYTLEYLGPLLIHTLFYVYGQTIFGQSFEHTKEQRLMYVMVMLHYIKREFETQFVHKFSGDTLPIYFLFKNSTHYWLLGGLNMAVTNYGPESLFAKTSNPLMKLVFGRQFVQWSDNQLLAISVVWLVGELWVGSIHMYLSSLRRPGSTERAIPYGYGFQLVSFPNYFVEIVLWIAFLLISQNISTLIFVVVASGQMALWAIKKHKRYRRDFPNYPRGRKALVPFIL